MDSDVLDATGLDRETELLYCEMLANPSDDLEQLRVRAGLTGQQMREALDQLSALSLVRASVVDADQFHAVNPQLGMQLLLARQEAELALHKQRMELTRAAAVKLISRYGSNHHLAGPRGGIEYLDGIDSIYDHLKIVNDDVTWEFLTFAPGGPQTAANMRSSRELNRRLLDRGVTMRTVYLDSIGHDPATMAHAQWLQSQGAQIRTVPTLPNRMIIYDRRGAIIAADSTNTGSGAIVSTTQGVITALVALFECVWASAHPLDGSDGTAASKAAAKKGLDRQQAETLRLLAEGLTDESIAKRLGVSARTARRIAGALLTHLNARSRFQAGVNAVRLGLLPDK